MSKVLLTIGFTTVLLPSDKGLATIMNALRDAVSVKADRSYVTEEPCVVIGEEVQVEFKTLPKRCKFVMTMDDGEEVPCEDVPSAKKPRRAGSNTKALPSRPTQLFLGGPR